MPQPDVTPAEELAGHLLVSLARLSRVLRRESPSALGQSSLSTLATLEREGALRPGDLAAREGVRPPTMTRIVASLESDGYVERAPDPQDRRACLIRLTAAGAEQLGGASVIRSARLAARIGQLPADQQTCLAAVLPVLDVLAGGEPTAWTGSPQRPPGPARGDSPGS